MGRGGGVATFGYVAQTCRRGVTFVTLRYTRMHGRINVASCNFPDVLSHIPCGMKISRIADFLCFAGTNFREFGFQTLLLGTNFRGSWACSCPVFHVRYFYITTGGYNVVLFILRIY